MKINKKILIFFLFWFFLLPIFVCFARELEIEYPTVPIPGAEGPPVAGTTLPKYFEYLFDLGMFLGFSAVFLSLVIAGVLYLISIAHPQTKARAKDQASGAITGLILLLATYLIITTINPELRFFRLHELEGGQEPAPPPAPVLAGVYFYNQAGCQTPEQDRPSYPYQLSIADLGKDKNRIKSVKIVHNPEGREWYIAVLYDLINFWGKCQYISPRTPCTTLVNPFADSASIYPFSFSPRGNGVYFYRKSFYNQEGGWYQVTNGTIAASIAAGRMYLGDLRKLKFSNVPEEEKICVEWNLKNECVRRQPPTLAGENISSIKIDGNYMVMLIYSNYYFCQAFPTPDDINKEGPKQIKWEAIRTQTRGLLPNYVMIIPVERK